MEEERNIGKIFYKNGFEFTNLRALVREAENVDLNDLLDRLLDLEKKMNSSAEIKDLASYVDERLESIEKIVNDDSYFNLSDVAVKSDYNAQVKAIKDKFHYARHLLDAEAEWKKQQDNYEKATISINQRLFKLDHDNTISGEEKNELGSELLAEKKAILKDHSDALENYLRCQEEYENSQKDFDLTQFRNGLLNNINKIEDSIKKAILDQSVDQNNKSKLDKILDLIKDMRENVVYYGLESTRAKKEFDDICKKFSLKYLKNDKEKNVEVPKKEEEPIVVSEVVEKPVNSTLVQTEEPVVQTSIKELVEKVYEDLKKLNPDVEFNLVSNPINPKFDGRIEASTQITNLYLPENFYYINNGITNRFSSSKDPVLIEIGELKKTEQLNQPVFEEVLDEPYEPLANTLDKHSENEKKQSVKRVRKAVMGTYAKTLLTFSAITGVAANIKNKTALTAGNVLEKLKNSTQTLYKKIVNNPNGRSNIIDSSLNDFADLQKSGDELMDKYKESKRRESVQNNTSLENEEQLEDLESGLQRALNEYDSNKAEILGEEPSRIGR